MSSKCKFCNEDITWGEYDAGKPSRPFSLDGSLHVCTNGLLSKDKTQTTPEPKIVKSAVKPQVIEISDIIEEIKLLKSEFGEIECAKFESIMKYAISRMMNRR